MEDFCMSENKNYEELGKDCTFCEECGGSCCKNLGCHFAPEDFEDLSFEYLKDKIERTGCISIDWWENDPRDGVNDLSEVLFLRMRNYESDKPDDPFTKLFSVLTNSNSSNDENNNKPAPIVDASWGGRCVLHTDKGCSIPYEVRPKGARWLIAKHSKSEYCDDAYSKQQCAIDWIPYQDILLKLKEYFNDKDDLPVKEYK